MSTEQDQIEKLRLLLSIKRYEQPPPGYFNRLPNDIIAQIRAERHHAGVGIGERLAWNAPWLTRVWQYLETKPVFAGSVGVAVCALLLAGVGYYTTPEPVPNSFATAPGTLNASSGSLISFPAQLSGEPAMSSPMVMPQTILASTSGVYSFGPSMPRSDGPYVIPVLERR